MTAQAARFLGQPVDVAYDAKDGLNPAFALLGVLASIPFMAASGVFGAIGLVACFLSICAFRMAVRTTIVAVCGDTVHLIAATRRTATPIRLLHTGTRDDIEFAGNAPFPSVRMAGRRLWFLFPITAAARRLGRPAS